MKNPQILRKSAATRVARHVWRNTGSLARVQLWLYIYLSLYSSLKLVSHVFAELVNIWIVWVGSMRYLYELGGWLSVVCGVWMAYD